MKRPAAGFALISVLSAVVCESAPITAPDVALTRAQGELQLAPPKMASGSGVDYAMGVAALAAGQLQAAAAAFGRASTASPTAPEPLIGLSEVAWRQHKIPEAESQLRRALAAAPRRADVQIAWAKLQLLEAHPDGARAAFERAAALDPKAVRARVDLGDLYFIVLKQLPQAIQHYESARALEPNNINVLLSLGRAQQQANRPADARATLAHAAAVAPKDPAVSTAYAEVLAESGSNKEAIALYDKVLVASPQLVPPRLGLARTLVQMGRIDEAIGEYDKVLQVDSRNVMALVTRGVLLSQRHRDDDAKQSFAAAYALDSHLPQIMNDVAWQEVTHHGDLERALAMSRGAVALAPGEAAYHDTLGWVWRARGDLPQATAELRKAAAKTPTPEILTHLATVRAESGDRTGALQALQQALTLDAKYQPALDARKQLATGSTR